MALNVNREITDQFYRYKMPRLLTKVEGKGNGIKTVIVNMVDVAKSLDRPATYPTKYFGCELGAQTQFDIKHERYIVNGSHDSNKLQDLLDGFIKRFVLCTNCDNPETKLVIRKSANLINARCAACGHQSTIDMRHKLTTFIIKNPPEVSEDATPQKKNGKSKQKDSDEDINNIEANDGWDDDDWVEVEKETLTSGIEALAFTSDLDKPEKDRINLFYGYVQKLVQDNNLSGSDAEINKAVYTEANRLDIVEKASMVLAELLFNEEIIKQFLEYRLLFLRFTHQNPKAQKYLLGAIEILVGKEHREALLPKVAHVLKAGYDQDILEEEVLIEWNKKCSKKYVPLAISEEIHEKAKVFINWLEQASEEESDEDEDDGVQIDFTNASKAGMVVEEKNKPEITTVKLGNEEIDIDDI